MVILSARRRAIQVVLQEPPSLEYTNWQKERVKFYRRLEGVQPRRDAVVPRSLPATTSRYNHAVDKETSDRTWNFILRTHDDSDNIAVCYKRMMGMHMARL